MRLREAGEIGSPLGEGTRVCEDPEVEGTWQLLGSQETGPWHSRHCTDDGRLAPMEQRVHRESRWAPGPAGETRGPAQG